jgi:hypothetical protein
LPDAKLLLAGVYAARTDFGVDDAIAGIVNDIAGSIATAVSAAVVAPAGIPVVTPVTMMTPVVAMPTKTMTTTEVMTAAVKATTATMTATMAATGGRGSDESCGRSERNDYEKKLTKHFDLRLFGAGCTVSMLRSYAAETGRAVRNVTQGYPTLRKEME